MRRLRAISILVLLSAWLAGCELKSTAPLVNPAQAELAFGPAFTAIMVQEKGSLVDTKGAIFAVTGTARGNVYEMGPGNGGEGGTMAFLPVRGMPFDYLLQMSGKDGFSYTAVRKTEGGAAVANIDLNPEILKTLEARGIRPIADGMNHRVESRGALDETVRGWAEARSKGGRIELPFRFEIARGTAESEALMARALTQHCLARAGHPLDPEVKKLPGKLAFGVALERIDSAAATTACAWGAQPEAPDSVRYALARIHVQAKQYDRLPALMEPMIARDYPFALLLRADQLMRGLGVGADVAAGRRLLEDAAPRHPLIAYNLGAMHAGGRFGQPDYAAARRLYEQAAAAGVGAAKVGLGYLYADGAGVARDEPRAFGLFREGADAGELAGYVETGRALYFGTGTGRDHEGAYGYLKTAAAADHPEAQYMAGFMLSQGQGVAKSETEGFKLLEAASAAGILPASAEVGRMTYYGLGTRADRQKGRQILEEAAGKGSQAAKTYLAALTGQPLPDLPSGVPDEVKSDVRKLGGKEAFSLNHVNMPFMAGMAQHLGKVCGLPGKMDDRLELTGLALNGASSMLGGPDYSNPDIGKAVGAMMSSTALLAAGAKFAEQIPCDSPLAEHIADRLVAASRSNKTGAGARFVPSCAPTFGETRCACLAQIGRGVIPDIYQRSYDRGIIKEIISRNPLLGLTIGLTCQISNY